jgi:DNA-binding GntR family transcriptional regulator
MSRMSSRTTDPAGVGDETESVSERTYQELRARIIGGALPPGAVVTERKAAELIGVSRTPLRAALVRLEGEGLVQRLDNRAVTIRRFSIEDLLELLVARRALEAEAAGIAAARAEPGATAALRAEAQRFAAGEDADFERFWAHDDRFHHWIAETSGQGLLRSLIDDLRGKARMCHVPRMPHRFVDQCSEHLVILDAIDAGNREAAAQAMRAHVDAVRQRLIGWLL